MLLLTQAQIMARHPAEAAARLQTWVALHPRDTAAWSLLASARSGQGQTLASIRAEAEGRVAQMDYPAAVDRLKAAQEIARKNALAGPAAANSGNEHIEASIIDTRVRQVESLLREQALER
jgi:predicted Zn-dependent protease